MITIEVVPADQVVLCVNIYDLFVIGSSPEKFRSKIRADYDPLTVTHLQQLQYGELHALRDSINYRSLNQ